MSQKRTWKSPDGKITKIVNVEGIWGKKPTEGCECLIKITSISSEFQQFNDNSKIVIGDNDGSLGRNLDICLMSMNEQELADFTITPDNISCTIQLFGIIKTNDLIYQWSARKKLEIAQYHKDKGVELFKKEQSKDAAYRFTKAAKILSSIPMDVENPPQRIDDVPVSEIELLKANLFNNLASYYLKHQAWLTVIDICKKVLHYDKDNVKAHYKLGVAYMKDRNFEMAANSFETVLKFEPTNKAASENLRLVKEEIKNANVKFNMLVKKMFN